jgi:hypothetical protein
MQLLNPPLYSFQDLPKYSLDNILQAAELGDHTDSFQIQKIVEGTAKVEEACIHERSNCHHELAFVLDWV